MGKLHKITDSMGKSYFFTMMMRRGILLDRDGTIIRDPGYVRKVEQVELLPGAGEGLALLCKAGFGLVVVSNQSAVARGWLSLRGLVEIRREVDRQLAPFGVKLLHHFYCTHHENHGSACNCRKPEPGLLHRAMQKFGWEPSQCWMVGDTLRDWLAGQRAGVPAASINWEDRAKAQTLQIPVFADLHEFAKFIISKEGC